MPSQAFLSKKAKILQALGQSSDDYTDKSPKGSVDAPIVDLIHEINSIDGLVTTSSCSGRVAVFVEGPKSQHDIVVGESGEDEINENGENGNDEFDATNEMMYKLREVDEHERSGTKVKVKTGPGGKGGGQWLFVSHEPVPVPSMSPPSTQSDTTGIGNYYTKLCGLQQEGVQEAATEKSTTILSPTSNHRLIKLSFSPLILHILTADLAQHARPLLSAAINAGFRESGIQSLAAVDPKTDSSQHTGTMLAIRTCGLAFETVIGYVTGKPITRTSENTFADDGDDVTTQTEIRFKPLVSEEYLDMCFGVINERFRWNEVRKERLRGEIYKAFRRVMVEENGSGRGRGRRPGWEGKEERRQRLREEGLRRKVEKELQRKRKNEMVQGDGFVRSSDKEDDDDSGGDLLMVLQ